MQIRHQIYLLIPVGMELSRANLVRQLRLGLTDSLSGGYVFLEGGEPKMKQWKTPWFEEVSLCCEINSYTPAEI
jgi:coenzyme PQQ precursor peptide PqqA